MLAQLPVTDPTPALEVNLTPSASSDEQQAAASSSTLTEINLNENTSTTISPPVNELPPRNNSEANVVASSSATSTAAAASANPMPPECELPSYNEAIRQKKLEAYGTELPPSYFDPMGEGPEMRPTIDSINVRYTHIPFSNMKRNHVTLKPRL